jgi:hypothetical protein
VLLQHLDDFPASLITTLLRPRSERLLLALSTLTQLVIVYPEALEQPASATGYRLPSAARRLCLQSANVLIDNLGWR